MAENHEFVEIYIYKEREREIYIHTYIYIWIYWMGLIYLVRYKSKLGIVGGTRSQYSISPEPSFSLPLSLSRFSIHFLFSCFSLSPLLSAEILRFPLWLCEWGLRPSRSPGRFCSEIKTRTGNWAEDGDQKAHTLMGWAFLESSWAWLAYYWPILMI